MLYCIDAFEVVCFASFLQNKTEKFKSSSFDFLSMKLNIFVHEIVSVFQRDIAKMARCIGSEYFFKNARRVGSAIFTEPFSNKSEIIGHSSYRVESIGGLLEIERALEIKKFWLPRSLHTDLLRDLVATCSEDLGRCIPGFFVKAE